MTKFPTMHHGGKNDKSEKLLQTQLKRYYPFVEEEGITTSDGIPPGMLSAILVSAVGNKSKN